MIKILILLPHSIAKNLASIWPLRHKSKPICNISLRQRIRSEEDEIDLSKPVACVKQLNDLRLPQYQAEEKIMLRLKIQIRAILFNGVNGRYGDLLHMLISISFKKKRIVNIEWNRKAESHMRVFDTLLHVWQRTCRIRNYWWRQLHLSQNLCDYAMECMKLGGGECFIEARVS